MSQHAFFWSLYVGIIYVRATYEPSHTLLHKILESYSTKVVVVENQSCYNEVCISATQPRHLLIKLCREKLFRISNLIKSNRQNNLKLGVGFKTKAWASVCFTKLGWRSWCIFVSGMCVRGWKCMFKWLGCVRRVEMYWEEGRKETTPLYHICYIMFISS